MSVLRMLLRSARLVLPVLVPSWRFFDSIGPSPRIEYRVWSHAASQARATPADGALPWAPWVLTPASLRVRTLFARLPFNAARNEVLYLLACCERVVDEGSTHAEQQIAARLAAHVREERLAAHVGEARLAAHVGETRTANQAVGCSDPAGVVTCLQFRIVEVFREREQLRREVAFESAVMELDAPRPPR